jgi:HEAT repeat protein
MNDEIFQLLRSKNPDDRKQAIRELAQLRDREVLRYLATVYKEDPDAEVRDMAIRAGKYVKKQLEAGEWTTDPVSSTANAPAKTSSPARTSTDDPNATRARALMDKAMDESVRGNYDSARKQAEQAFALYPALRHDSYYTSLASEVMGMPVEEAVAALMSSASAAPAKRKAGCSAVFGGVLLLVVWLLLA